MTNETKTGWGTCRACNGTTSFGGDWCDDYCFNVWEGREMQKREADEERRRMDRKLGGPSKAYFAQFANPNDPMLTDPEANR